MILKIQNRISAFGNPYAKGFNFFAHPLCAFEGALGFAPINSQPHIAAHLQTRTSHRSNQRFAKELQFTTRQMIICNIVSFIITLVKIQY
jgi:hypothetical protein